MDYSWVTILIKKYGNTIQPNKIYITGHPKYDFNWQKNLIKEK